MYKEIKILRLSYLNLTKYRRYFILIPRTIPNLFALISKFSTQPWVYQVLFMAENILYKIQPSGYEQTHTATMS